MCGLPAFCRENAPYLPYDVNRRRRARGFRDRSARSAELSAPWRACLCPDLHVHDPVSSCGVGIPTARAAEPTSDTENVTFSRILHLPLNPSSRIRHPVSGFTPGCPLHPSPPAPPNITGVSQSHLSLNVRREGGHFSVNLSYY